MTKAQTQQAKDSADKLRAMLAPNGTERKTVYCLLRHRSASGMSRRISFMAAVEGPRGPEICDITWHVGQVTHYKTTSRGEGLLVSGCGMDMGFAVVYDLGSSLWPEGTEAPHGTRNGENDTTGGYALHHSWL